jgi:membrane associated rhomboid family serine protease
VLGAYFLLFPGSSIRTLVFIGAWPVTLRIRAFWFILIWVSFQVMPAIDILLTGADYHVGYWAHLGGFFGAALIFFFIRPEVFQRLVNGVSIY